VADVTIDEKIELARISSIRAVKSYESQVELLSGFLIFVLDQSLTQDNDLLRRLIVAAVPQSGSKNF
jgi:hypothetical protein